MMLSSPVEQEIRDQIQEHGRITFARFMQYCLYSPNGGFYAARSGRISAHFGTSSTMHPAFGALIARQLEQMWHILGDPDAFHLIEVGSGDGSLARSIMDACERTAPRFARALCYVAADYQPVWPQSPGPTFDWTGGAGDHVLSSQQETVLRVHRVKTEGLCGFRNIVGCILSNELIDNFPVHRFCIQDGRVREVYVTLSGGKLTEVLDMPSTPRVEERLSTLGLSLPEGYRGEVSLAMEDWIDQVCDTLDRGFVLTIDYGQPATDLYSTQNSQGTLVCHYRHSVSNDPYQNIGEQDITCQVDFTSLMRVGEQRGLATVGYGRQTEFLTNLGFRSLLDALRTRGMSAAREDLNRMAMLSLVHPDEYGDFKALAQAKGVRSDAGLMGFEASGTNPLA